MQDAKKWVINCIASLLILLFAAGALMVVVDPYFHYHAPLKGLSYRLYEERYINDGISRNFTFDAIITGTSMAQNFKCSEFDACFQANSIKEPFSGAGYQELSENLERALKRDPQITQVLWMLDFNGLLREYDWVQYTDYPTYLYDDNIWNDVSYLFNKSILYHGALANLEGTLVGRPSDTMDEYSAWEKESGLRAILYSYDREKIEPVAQPDYTDEDRENVKETITKNYIRLIRQYPDVTFYIPFSPYSICFFDAVTLEGQLEKCFQAQEDAAALLLEYPNVRLYDFFDRTEVICNTDLYTDLGHYNASVNSLMLYWMSNDIGLLTKENYREKIREEYLFYAGYDYDSIYR